MVMSIIIGYIFHHIFKLLQIYSGETTFMLGSQLKLDNGGFFCCVADADDDAADAGCCLWQDRASFESCK